MQRHLTEKERTHDSVHTGRMPLRMLLGAVADIAQQVYIQLGSGLPKSVYQLMLSRQLADLGVQLESQALDYEPVSQTEAIVLDNRLLIHCLAGDDDELARKQCEFSLACYGYRLGLLIDFGNDLRLQAVSTTNLPRHMH